MRCPWPGNDPLYVSYHDTEWGVPEYDDRRLFEKLMLDGFQAGLSWLTILRKRENFQAAFDGFEPEIIAGYGETEITRLLGDAGIIRHRGKIEATIGNARAYLKIRDTGTSFKDFCWRHVGGHPVQNSWQSTADIPAQTEMSVALSKDLKQSGFKFCGPVIVYAFTQAVGMVNDHLVSCPQHKSCAAI